MIESLSRGLFVPFVFGALIFILFVLLPSLFVVERSINRSNEKQNCQLKISPLEQVDEREVDNLVVGRLAEVIAVLPDMES